MSRYVGLGRVINGIPEQTLIWLSNDNPQATVHDIDVINQIIGDAEDLVDDTLRGRYTLPLLNVPTSVGRITLYIARHDLYARRPENAVPADVVRTYNAALKTLEAIRDGSLNLGDETQASQPDNGNFHVRGPDRKISDSVLNGY